MKATSLFGGVQVFNIIISIIRSKFIAVLLGPTGIGIVGLLSATIGLISGLTKFGLGTSAIRNVSLAFAKGNQIKIATIVIVLRRWVWITGLLGAFVTLAFSPWLSQLTFGNRDYTIAFIWLSITLLFNQLSAGQLVVLQGMRKLHYLAKANMAGNFLGLITTVPLYYLWGIDAIVPALVISSGVTLLLSWYFANKVKIEPVRVSRVRTIAEGKNMLTMGFVISLSGLITMGTSYLVRIYISNIGGILDVGLYNAGFAIITTYVGLIFTAMGTDYYPRLSAVADNNIFCKETINQQAEIALLIMIPIIIIFLVFIHWVVVILYSSKFIGVTDMIHWAALGMIFKATSWVIAFIFLAKGNYKLFFWNELIADVYILIFNLIGYKLGGLTGLGQSFMIGLLVYLIQVFIIAKIKYQFSFSRVFINIFVIQLLLAICSFIIVKSLVQPYPYILGSGLVLISIWYSFIELDKRLGLKAFFIKHKQ